MIEGCDLDILEGTCPWCGSMSGEEFMTLVKGGHAITPTDKNYKAYLCCGGGPSHKFYFNHLDYAQVAELYDLYLLKRVTMRHPGYFYREPYVFSYEERMRSRSDA